MIFMAIVPEVSRGESVRGGKPADTVVLEALEGVRDEPIFRIDQQPAARQDLVSRLANFYANRPQRVLFVKGDHQLSFTEIAEAIDIGHAAGADSVGIFTPGAKFGLQDGRVRD